MNWFDRFLIWFCSRKVYESSLGILSNRITVVLHILAGILTIVYLFLDFALGSYQLLLPLSAMLVVGFGIGIILIRRNQIQMTKVIVLLIYNITVFFGVKAQPLETELSLYLLCLMMGAIVVFDIRHLNYAIIFVIIPIAGFLLVKTTDFTFFETSTYSQQTIDIFFALNLTVFTVATAVSLVSYIRMVHNQNQRIQQQSENLKVTNQELDYFLFSTSHDLRAPLTTISGLINLAHKSDDRSEITSYHTMMKERIGKMDSYIKDIIEVIRNSRLPISKSSVMPYQFVKSIVDEIRDPLRFDRINWIMDIEKLDVVYTDKDRLKVILKNLLINSVRFVDFDEKEPTVKVKAGTCPGGYFFEVWDNGIGIEKERITEVFDMFYRASERATGAGLGLYIARESSKKINGELKVESVHGEWTNFRLTIPY